jgi:hypothetical protein
MDRGPDPASYVFSCGPDAGVLFVHLTLNHVATGILQLDILPSWRGLIIRLCALSPQPDGEYVWPIPKSRSQSDSASTRKVLDIRGDTRPTLAGFIHIQGASMSVYHYSGFYDYDDEYYYCRFSSCYLVP